MRVVLEVVSGDRSGHKVLLTRGQVLQVGRTHRADVTFEHDAKMSGVHFKFHSDSSCCRLEDLESTNGTFVNGQRVKQAMMRDKDTIVAGETTFHVHLEQPPAENPTQTAVAPEQIVLPQGTYTHHVCDSSLNCYRGDADTLPPLRLSQALSQEYQQALILDPSTMGSAVDSVQDEVLYLFDWLAEEIRAKSSPLLLTSPEQMRCVTAIEDGWGKDAVIALYWEQDADFPVEQLRQASGVFVRPSLLRPQLEKADPDYVRGLLEGIEAVLIEADSPEDWLVFSANDLTGLLRGQELIPSEEPAPS